MKRILSVIFAIAVTICSFAICTNASSVLKDAGIDYTDSTATLSKNPGRGPANYTDSANWLILKNGKMYSTGGSSFTASKSQFSQVGIYTPMFELSQYSSGNSYTQDGYPNAVESGKVGGENKDLDEDALNNIASVFECIKEAGAVCIPRFAYTHEHISGSEPDDINQILRHMDQIIPILNEYAGTVIAVEAGMIGPWGEMHCSPYRFETLNEKTGAEKIIDKWNDLDESIAVLVRYMGYVICATGVLPVKFAKDYSYLEGTLAERMGLFNDGYLGTYSDYGTWNSLDDITSYKLGRKQGIEYLKHQGEIAPYGGELAYVDSVSYMKANGSIIYDDDPTVLTRELYDSHLTYLRNISHSQVTADALRNVTLTKEMVYDGMPDVSPYYGMDMNKFMTDHMGYRFVIRSSQLSSNVKKGGTLTIKGTVENTGFANIYFAPHTQFIFVDSQDGVLTADTNIDPKSWLSATKSDYLSIMSVPSGLAEGEVKVYIRIGTTAAGVLSSVTAGTVAFANSDVYDKTLGANYIGSFNVLAEVAKDGVDDFEELNDSRFTDVASASWYNEAVYYSVANGLFSGMTPTTFEPETPTSRAMLVKVLHNLEGQPDVSGLDNPFTDVKAGDWYEKAVIWAFHNNITSGMTETTFGPSLNITREQFAAFLYRYAGYKGVDTSKENSLSAFTDAGDISSYAVKPLAWANREGFITGMTNTILNPKGNATRAQMASILMRYTRAYD